ncbi:MAG: hypothetical protein P4L50_16880 [Anaerolineaceae bacterium]|nr:hypothetical protein [Anaerolineaceae bacterium]
MVFSLLVWIYTLVFVFLYGWLAVRLLERLFACADGRQTLPFPLIWAAGLALSTSLASILSLFIKIGLAAHAILLAGAVFSLMIHFKQIRCWIESAWIKIKSTSPLVWVLAALAVVTLLEISTLKPANPDTEIYHAQAIHWIESYPAVPGLGNLHTRLAYDSSWLVANALFSFSFLKLRSFHLLGSVLFLLCLIYFIGGLNRLIRREVCPSAVLKVLLLPVIFLIFGSESSSPGTDLPAALLIWIIILGWVELIESGQGTRGLPAILLLLLSVFTVTIKLYGAPLLLAGIFLFLRPPRAETALNPEQVSSPGRDFSEDLVKGGLSFWLKTVLVAGLILLPWLARNVILSGYLVYPFPTVDIFQFDWKIPHDRAVIEQQVIQAWARIPGSRLSEVSSMSLHTWLRTWFNSQTGNRRIILLVVLGAPLAYLLLALLLRKRLAAVGRAFRPYLLVYLVVYAGVIFWFVSAPDIRFGYGYLMIAFLLVLLPPFYYGLRWAALSNWRFDKISLLLLLLLILYQGSVLALSLDTKSIANRLVLPADYVNLPTHPCQFHNFEIACADQFSVCGYSAFPCAPQADPAVAQRGKHLQDGFFYEVPIK